MNSRGGFIDVFNGLRIFGLVFVFSVFAVFAANMGTQFLTLLSPYLVMVAWPLKILGYHNASMALFFVNLTVYLVVRIVDGFRKFSLG